MLKWSLFGLCYHALFQFANVVKHTEKTYYFLWTKWTRITNLFILLQELLQLMVAKKKFANLNLMDFFLYVFDNELFTKIYLYILSMMNLLKTLIYFFRTNWTRNIMAFYSASRTVTVNGNLIAISNLKSKFHTCIW